jgi:HEAT repeat protein
MEDGKPTAHIHPLLLTTFLLMAIAPGCANHIGTTAASFMQKIQESPDPNIRHVAYQKLANRNCYNDDSQMAQAAQMLSARLVSGKEPIASRTEICRTLGRLGRPEAREAVIKACDDDEPIVRAEACRALGHVGTAEDVPVLSRHMTSDNAIDCRIAAIEGLGILKIASPQLEIQLVDGMEDEDPAIRVSSLRSIRAISGQDFGPEVGPWRKYALTRLEREGGSLPPSLSDQERLANDPAEANPTRSPVFR